jgi:NAD(P)-dependent dehydrogenase (short-subunit alcohol dehydrogenase family)
VIESVYQVDGQIHADAIAGAEAARAQGGAAVGLSGDVSREVDVQKAIETAQQRYGRLDLLVNNAGFALKGAVTDIIEADWDRSMAVNVKGVFLYCKHAVPLMLGQGGGVIVNVASRVGLRGIANMSAYSASKGAVVMLTYSLALEYAERNIRVNCVCPASVDTPALEHFWPQFPDPSAAQCAAEAIPMKRMASAEEIAEAIAYLASDQASFVTGIALPVDGGRCAGS